MTYAVIMQYPKDKRLEENRVAFFGTLAEAKAWRDKQSEPWLKVFRVSPVGDDMYERAYFDIQNVLDGALGTEEEDGAGEGITADVRLLAYRYELALKAIESVGGTVTADSIRKAQMPDPFEGMAS